VSNEVKVRIQTEVVMDLDVMAKAFANMGSNEQAMFLATAFQEMGNYSGGKGAYGREMQMLHIKDEFDAQPDAREFITTLYEMTCIVDKPQVAWDDYPGSSQYAIAKADELIYEYLDAQRTLRRMREVRLNRCRP